MTIFRGRVNHHFRAVLAIVWEDVTSSMLAQPKKKSICPRAQKIQLCNIFRGRMDHYSGVWLLFETNWRCKHVCKAVI